MTTTVDLVNGASKKAPRRMTLMLGSLLLSHGGSMPIRAALEVAWELRTGNRNAMRMVVEALAPLVGDGVVVRRGETLYAPSMADLAAWIADGFEYREDAGMGDDPEVPPALEAEVPVQRGGRGRRVSAA